MIVTDVKWRDDGGILREGYSMDNYLVENLTPTPKFLAQDRDMVGIISGHGDVRNGKSTIAIQIGYFLAWMQAGGRMDLRKGKDGKYINPVVLKKPNKPVNFSYENLVYTPEGLIDLARTLANKYGKSQIMVYDETSGLDSKGTMKAVNQMLSHFFQTCGAYNHIILIVLPDFFKLNEDIATTRSMFLVDTYSDENWSRGLFNFYGPRDKEWLYFNGKKLRGIGVRYASQNPTFYGRFTRWIPFDREEYEAQKQEKLKAKVYGSREQQIREKYWGILAVLKHSTNLTTKEIAEELSEVLFRKVTTASVGHDIRNYQKFSEKHQKGGTVT